jgi:hypothetical protein
MAIKVGTLQVDLISNTASFTGPLDKAGQQAKRTAKDIQDGFNGMDLGEARGSIMVLGEELGIHLPRHVQAFIATLPGVGAAMNAAFPILAVVAIGVAVFEAAEKLAKLGEEAKKIAQGQISLGTAINSTFNSLDAKLLQAGIHTDELNQNHFAALKKQLELIDLQSMDELAHTFDALVKDADKSFDTLKVHWYEFGIGSEGARSALTAFQVQYNALLAKKDGKGASDLLAGTLSSAEKILAFQKQYLANQMSADTQKGPHGEDTDYNKFEEASLALKKAGVGATEKEVQSQEALVNTLRAQVGVQGDIAKLDDSEKGNKKRDDLRQTIALLDKQYATEKQGTQAQTKEALAAYQVEFDQGKITAEQLADLKQQALDKEYTAELAHLEKVRALEAREPALRKQTDEQIAALNATHNAQILADDAAALNKRNELQKELDRIIGDENRKSAADEVALALKTATEKDKIFLASNNARLDKDKQHTDALGAIEAQGVQFKREMGLISEADYEAQMQTELNVTYMTARKELQAKRDATVQGTADRMKADAQLQALEDKYQKDSERNEQQSLLRRANNFRQLSSTVTSSLDGWIRGTETFSQAWNKLWSGMATTAIESLIQVGVQEVIGLAIHQTIADKKKLTDAKSAFHGAYAATSDIPIIGPVLAPIAGAAAFAAVMAFEKGGIVPQDAYALVHHNEMVLPAPIASFIVNAASQGSGNGGGQNHFVFAPTVHAVDAEGVDRMLTKHADTFHRHVKAHMRRLNYA